MTEAALIWSYLAEGPLLWLTATLVAYVIGDAGARATGRQSWANPVLIAVILLVALLWLSDVPYRRYFEGAPCRFTTTCPGCGAQPCRCWPGWSPGPGSPSSRPC